MGITGLLPFLKNASKPGNISQFKGCTAAVDSYCWLHKGAFACADKLALGEPTDQCVDHTFNNIFQIYLHFDPYLGMSTSA